MSSLLRLKKRQSKNCRFSVKNPKKTSHTPLTKNSNKSQDKLINVFRLHPLFLLVGFWYCLKGELFLFLLSALVAIQHECAHAFAAAKLGYRLNAIVLMPFGAVIDGDLHGISLKDEIFVAVCGPLCNLITAIFFIAIWWLHPTMYAFTDTACYSSLSIALVNLLPAYPLDGGRILKCLLAKHFLNRTTEERKAEQKAYKICRWITLFFALFFFAAFFILHTKKTTNITLLAFGLFLLVGALGTQQKEAVYNKLPIERPSLKKGVEIRRIAVLDSCPIKDTFRFLSRGCFLVLEVYDENENHLFNLTQTELSLLFEKAPSPYSTLRQLCINPAKNTDFFT